MQPCNDNKVTRLRQGVTFHDLVTPCDHVKVTEIRRYNCKLSNVTFVTSKPETDIIGDAEIRARMCMHIQVTVVIYIYNILGIYLSIKALQGKTHVTFSCDLSKLKRSQVTRPIRRLAVRSHTHRSHPMTRPLHIAHILAGLNRVLDNEQLLQSGRTVIRMAIAEIAHQHPEASTIPRATMLNPEGDEP